MAWGLSLFCDCGMDCIVIMADTVDNCIDSLENTTTILKMAADD